jgi:hypothetical protein
MLLAVAGLDKDSLDDRTRRLASGDWATFPPGDRYAFGFACKLSREARSITDGDVRGLVDHFGAERSIDVIWWACRCHYMTRVADAFQLPLERENVFQPTAPPPREGGDRKP